jgi:hypothetical protein
MRWGRYALWNDKLHIDEVKATGIDPRAADRTTSKFRVGAGTQDLAGKVAWNTCALLNPQDRAAIDKKEYESPTRSCLLLPRNFFAVTWSSKLSLSLCGDRHPQLGFTKKIMEKVQQRPGVMQKFSETLQQQREAKLRAKRGLHWLCFRWRLLPLSSWFWRHVARATPCILAPACSSPPRAGELEVFEVNTTNEIDWDELRRFGAEIEHESIIMLGSKVCFPPFLASISP